MRASTRYVCILVAVAFVASAVSVALPSPASGENPATGIGKLEPELRTQVQESMKSAPDTVFRTVVFLDDGADVSKAGKAMTRAGAMVGDQFDAIGALSVEMSAMSAMKVVGLDQVKSVYLDGMKYLLPAMKLESETTTGAAAPADDLTEESIDIWWASTSAEMGAEDAWELGFTGDGVVVAVLDTGCDLNQLDLDGAIVAYKSFTSEEFHDIDGHGTATAGLVASRGVNDYVITQFDGVVKMKGMAPESLVMAGKVLTDDGWGYDSWIIGGINWAVSGDDGVPGTGDEADIISMSLGGMEVPNDGNDPTSYALDIAAEEYGIASFLSAGNEGLGQSTVGSAGVSKTTITVGASTLNPECQLLKYWPLSDYYEQYLIVKEGEDGYENNHMIWFSSRGPAADGRIDPDICAAGAWGPSLAPSNAIQMQFGGTSMAAPVAAGIGALVYQAFVEENGIAPTPDELKEIIMGTAMDMGYGPNEQGPGRVDAVAACEAVMNDWEAPGSMSVALTLGAGDSASVAYAAATTLSSRAIVPSGDDSVSFSDVCAKATDIYKEFEVPDGVDYLTIDLAFAQKPVFSRDVHNLRSAGGYTDTHLNIILYRLDEAGERTMINYAYAHTNTQEMNARVTPGDYELRISPVMYTVPTIPFDVGIEFFTSEVWSWVSIDGSEATVAVPFDAIPGVHAGFIEVDHDGVSSLVPVAVSVPITIGEEFEDSIDVGHEVWGFNEGDWKYYFVDVPEDCAPPAMTAVLDWESWNTDIDMYWITPDRSVQEMSITPYIRDGIFGPWTTSTGDSADVLTVLDPEPGMWMLALHIVLMEKVLQEPYSLVVLPYSAAEFGVESIFLKPNTATTVELNNNLDFAVGVGLRAVSNALTTTTESYAGSVSSFDQGGDGAVDVLFDVDPLTVSTTVTIEWGDPDADIDVTVYGGDWSNWGMLWESGDSLVFENPVPGEWDAAVALANSALEVTYWVNVTTVIPAAWTSLTLSASEVWLDPMGSMELTVSLIAPMGTTAGIVVAYDLVTGCEYDSLIVSCSGKSVM
jgi:subtilisin family serine protease